MNVLIVGGGGREHAIAKKVRHSRHKPSVYCAPGNAGTALLGENLDIGAEELDRLAHFACDHKIDLTLVGPEAPLCAGIVDRFEQMGLRVFGPSAEAARIEGDKGFTKRLLIESRIPTARGRVFTRYQDARSYIATRDTPQVVKAVGLAAGKGVVVCEDPADALLEAERMMVDGRFGDAGRSVVVEEKLVGQEVSVLALVDAGTVYVLEPSQDHKPIGEGDTGPNTGGMGAYSPTPIMDEPIRRKVESEILIPFIDTLRRHGITYRGVLYAGLMLTAAGPQVLEFNCRFGDPEAQAVLVRLKSDLIDVVNACLDGKLDHVTLEWDPRPAVCVVMASEGYPGKYAKGKVIEGLAEAEALPDVTVHHAGTQLIEDVVVTNGGRVLAVTAQADTLGSARDRAYEAVRLIRFDGAHYRRDIAYRALGAPKERSV